MVKVAMPALRLFGRQWLLSSDDLPLPMAGLMTVHTIWCIIVLVVYERAHRLLRSHCEGGSHAMAWLFGTFTCYFISLVVEAMILHASLRGRILEPGKRKYVPYLLYTHLLVLTLDIAFTVMGTVLDYGAQSCYSRARVHAMVLCIIVGNYIVIFLHFVGIFLMFSMFGHLPTEQKWYKIFNVVAAMLCLKRHKSGDPKLERELNEQGSLGHIANCFAEVFQGADVVPSDIAAGLGLLAIQHRHLIEDEPLGKVFAQDSDALAPYNSLGEMYEDAAHFARWALAAYGWALLAWADPRTGLSMACSADACVSCCGCRRCVKRSESHIHDLDKEALKRCAGINSDDLIYVSLANGVGEPPYFIAKDVRRKAIVVSIRGTLSIADCVTDSMYKPVMLDAESIGAPELHGSDLHVHSGVLRATNFVLSDLAENRVLEQTILGEAPRAGSAPIPQSSSECQGWNLILTGHSLGAGVSATLSLYLRRSFPNLKVWCIEPPGGVLSPKLAEITKAWTYSTVHHCDLFCRLSGPALLKLRSDMMDSLTNSRLNKFSLLMRMTFNGTQLRTSDVIDAQAAPDESTLLREDFRALADEQINATPMMAAPLHPPGQLIHLHKLKNGSYEPRLVEAEEFMKRGMMIQSGFFTDHFPDKVAGVLSDLAMSGTDAALTIASLGTSSDDPSCTLVDKLVNQSSKKGGFPHEFGTADNV